MSKAISTAAAAGKITGCRVSPTTPVISHLLFVDDSFMFFRATTEETKAVRSILHEYRWCLVSPSTFRNQVYFLVLMWTRVHKKVLKNSLGVYADFSQGIYLGLPSLIGRSKKAMFTFLKERLWKRIQSWGTKLLSRAGKAVLLKNVAQAIPSYCMYCFLIPKSLCKEMERIMNGFWWSSNDDSKKGVKWLAWENMSMHKTKGGMRFQDLHGFNLAFLGKHCWNFLNNPDSLVARVYKARYFPNYSFLKAGRGGG